jgi:LPS-assembly lipoprotein
MIIRHFLAYILLALTVWSCGFQPLMGARVGAPADLAQVRVDVIADRSGQILRNNLEDALNPKGPTVDSRYRLEVRLYEPRQEIAIRRDVSASRVSYTANATFILTDNLGRSLFSGSSSSSSTFEATNSEFGSVMAQRNARDRALEEISGDIRQQLAAYFGGSR